MKRAKYGNKKVWVDGYKFDSKKEAARYRALFFMQKAGEISYLTLQPKFKYYVKGKWQFTYNADFSYIKDGYEVVEDVKSPATQKDKVYRLKKRIIEAEYEIKIKEVV